MGYSKSTTIGPYLKVKGKIELKTTKVKRICPNHIHKETNDKFCPQCGTLVESKEYVDTKMISPQQFMYMNFEEDKLWVPESSNVILPNQYPPKKFKIDSDNGGDIDISESTQIIGEQLDWFKENYSSEIKTFEENFGKDNVNVCWGVVTYWS